MRAAGLRRAAGRVLAGTGSLAGAIALASVLPAGAARAGATPPPPQAAAGSIGVRLDTAPGNQRAASPDSAYIIRYMPIGTSARAIITVSNTTKATQRVSVYAGAASMRGGAFTFGAGPAPNELTTWTKLSTGLLVLNAHTQKPVTVTIRVPGNASRGQRYAVIWAQASSGQRHQITMVSRVGIRMYISVGAGGPPPPGFTIESMTAQLSTTGAKMIVARVRNTGGTAVGVSGTLKLTHGPGGVTAGPLPLTQVATIGAGHVGLVDVVINRGFPRGPWTSVLTLKAGLLQRTARARLTFPAAPSASSPAPWPAITATALALVLLAAAGYLMMRKRRRTT